MATKSNDAVLYHEDGSIAYITLNRPERLNAINEALLAGLEESIDRANESEAVRSIVLRGTGRAFCAGYDLSGPRPEPSDPPQFQDFNHDQLKRYVRMSNNVRRFMKLWHSPKPVIAQVHGYAVGGGSDMVLCSDVIFMADDAHIGYPPARSNGTPTSMMWVYRLGLEHTKYFLLTGRAIDAQTAYRIGLVSEVHPLGQLPGKVEEWARRLENIPWDHLALSKMLINQAFENMGLGTTQMLGTIMDGLSTNTYAHYQWNSLFRTVGFREAVSQRDRPWGDYGERPEAREARLRRGGLR